MVYQSAGVVAEIARTSQGADSDGTFLAKDIKPAYPAKKVSKPSHDGLKLEPAFPVFGKPSWPISKPRLELL